MRDLDLHREIEGPVKDYGDTTRARFGQMFQEREPEFPGSVDTNRFSTKSVHMPGTRPPYLSYLRMQMIALVHAGRSPEELAKGFQSSTQTIYWWARQVCRDGSAAVSLRDDEREALRRLCKENKQLRPLPCASAWFARKDGKSFGSSNS